MTSIWSRVQRVLGAEAHAKLDRAEDPQTMLAQMQRELVDAIGEVRLAAARATAWRQRTAASRGKLERDIEEAVQAARTALAADNEPMARTAIERRRSREAALVQATEQLAKSDDLCAKLADKRELMTRELNELRHKRAALEQRSRFAESVVSIEAPAFGLVSNATPEPIAAVVARMEDKVLGQEARADALLDLDEPRQPGAELDDFIHNQEIDAELKALRLELDDTDKAPMNSNTQETAA